MKKLIIITGDLASGKSTLADNLSKILKIPNFKKDTLKEIECDVFSFKNREENRLLSIAAMNNMFYIFHSLAKQGISVILDANFRNDELLKLKKICDEYDYEVKMIRLIGETNLLYSRFLERLKNRHIAHTSLHLDESVEKFEKYLLSIRNEDLLFPYFEIDITNFGVDDVLKQSISYINK